MGAKAGLFSRPGPKKVVALFVVLVVMSVPAASRIPREAEATVRPNIILVLTDDQDANTLQYMPYVAGEFQASATTFPNATFNLPLCCPSRVSILRGQYTHNHKIWDGSPPDGGYDRFVRLGEDNSHVARWLNKAGYRTGCSASTSTATACGTTFGGRAGGISSCGRDTLTMVAPLPRRRTETRWSRTTPCAGSRRICREGLCSPGSALRLRTRRTCSTASTQAALPRRS